MMLHSRSSITYTYMLLRMRYTNISQERGLLRSPRDIFEGSLVAAFPFQQSQGNFSRTEAIFSFASPGFAGQNIFGRKSIFSEEVVKLDVSNSELSLPVELFVSLEITISPFTNDDHHHRHPFDKHDQRMTIITIILLVNMIKE